MIDKAEDAHFMGRRVGDMDRDELLEVIQYLQDACIRSEDAHARTLDTWTAVTRARREQLH